MKIQIKHKITAKVLFECEALNMKVAIEIAIKASANLRYANLRYADLRYADLDYTSIPMWCGTLKGVKVDFNLVCQMLLHVFALECEDKRFKLVKKAIEKYAKLSTKWEYYKKA